MTERAVLGQAVLELTIDDAKLLAGMRRTRIESEGILTGIGKTATGVFTGIIGAQVIAGVFSVIKNELIGTGIGFNALKERASVAFTTILKDGEKAARFLDDLEGFARRTPFEFPDLVTGSQRLLAMGFELEQIIPLLTAVGDATAGLGTGSEGINRIVIALGQMQSRGKTASQEMLQLTEAGIPAWELLANKIGVSIPEAMKRVEKGQIAAGVTIEAVIDGLNERFGGMMTQQSTRWDGLWSTIRDTWRSISGTVMAPFFDRAERGLKKIVDVTNDPEFTKGVEDFADVVDDKLGDAMEWLDEHGPEIAQNVGEAWDEALPALREAADKAGDLQETLEDIADSPAVEITFDVAVLGIEQIAALNGFLLSLPEKATKAGGFIRDRLADAEALLRGGLQGGIPGMFNAAEQRARVAQGVDRPEPTAPAPRDTPSFFDRVGQGIGAALDELEKRASTQRAPFKAKNALDGLGDSADETGERVKTAVELILDEFDALASRSPRALQPLLEQLAMYREKAVEANDFGTVALIDGLLALDPTAGEVATAIGSLAEMYGELGAGIDAVLGKLGEQASRAPHTMDPLLDELELYKKAAADAGDATTLDLIENLLSLDPTTDQVRAAIGSLSAVYGDLQQAAEDAARQQEELARSLAEVDRMAAQALGTLKQNVTSELDFIGDAITTALRRQYDAQMDAELAAIEAQRQVVEDAGAARLRQIERDNDAQLEAEREASEQRIALWDAETKAQQDAIDARARSAIAPLQAQLDALAALDEKAKQDDYARQLADIDRQIAITYDPRKVEELLAQKAKILEQQAADERRKQRQQLEDQIRDIEDNARDQQRALDEQLREREAAERESLRRREDALRASLEAQQEAARAATAAQIAALDAQTERTREKYAALTTEYALQSEARTMILNGELDKIAALLSEYYPEFRTAGLSFGQQLIDGLRTSNVEGELRRILELMAAVNGPGVPGVNASNAQDVANAVASIARLIQGGAPQAAIDMQRQSFLDLFGFASPLATGGLITGPTLGLLGEYPGAQLDPEVAIRDSHLRQLIREESGGRGRGDINLAARIYLGTREITDLVRVEIHEENERQYRSAQLNGHV